MRLTLAACSIALACSGKKSSEAQRSPPAPVPPVAGGAAHEVWSKIFGALPVQGVAVGAQGACVVGLFRGSLALGGTTRTAAGDQDGFVACYAADGNERWSHVLTGPGGDSLRDVAIDASGGVYVLGRFGSVNVRAAPPTAGEIAGAQLMTARGGDMVLARFHGDGTLAWAKAIGGSGGELEAGLALTHDGTVIVVGDAYGELEVAGTKLGRAGQQDGFVLAFAAADGTPAWAVPLTGHMGTNAVAVAPTGTIFVGGYFVGPLVVNGTSHPNAGTETEDGFVVALAKTGAVQWTTTIDGPGKEGVSGLASDDAGVYAVGWFDGALEIAKHRYAPHGAEDGFVMRLDGDGAIPWFHPWGGSARDDLKQITVTEAGLLAVGATGGEQHVESVAQLPGVPVTVLGPSDGVTVGMSRDGVPRWSHTFGGPGRDFATGVASDASGAYVTGSSEGKGVLLRLATQPADR